MQSKSCGAVVYRKKGEIFYFLLLKHRSGNHWSLAKGHVNPGETEAQTALREIEEETGLHVDLLPGFRTQIRYAPYPGVEKDVVFFLAKTTKKKLKLQKSEIIHAVWLELEDALKLIPHQDTAQVLSRAQAFLKAPNLSSCP